MSQRSRKKYYPVIAKRDGDSCNICGVPVKAKLLVIDHIDNDNNNNAETNLQLLCRSCNVTKDHKTSRVSKTGAIIEPAITTTTEQMAVGRKARSKFLNWLVECLKLDGEMEYWTCVTDGSFITDVSAQTIERYITKFNSQYGPIAVTVDENNTRFIKMRENPKAFK